mgnify:CR=1 FL=1
MLDAGRLAYGAALAVPPVLSRLAMLERYYRDRSVGLPARWTPAEAHDNAVANLPATVRADGSPADRRGYEALTAAGLLSVQKRRENRPPVMGQAVDQHV